jgi:hypothetical protein
MKAALELPCLLALTWGCSHAPTLSLAVGNNAPTVIAGLDGCDDYDTERLHLNADEPVVLLVHGCNASSGRFRVLAQVFRFHGQQVLCFNYDDRDRLDDSAAALAQALQELARRLPHREISVIGHSQGGLVARRALTVAHQKHPSLTTRIRLVTVSSPFNGIRAATHCGLVALHVVSLGLTVAMCQAITGSKWNEIHRRASFLRRPGTMVPSVTTHLRIATDERGSCRTRELDGGCATDDFVFSLAEQQTPVVDGDPRVVALSLRAGHGAVVGTEGAPPVQLIRLLQQHRILRSTAPGQQPELARLLQNLYGF